MTRYNYDNTDNADAGAAEVRGYTAAEAAGMFQDFLEDRISREGFIAWLDRYPYALDGPAPAAVEDEINRATLNMRALVEGRRDWAQVREELLDCRGRLSGHAFQSGEVPRTGETRDPAGNPIDRSFP
jgi:hypothetical protein